MSSVRFWELLVLVGLVWALGPRNGAAFEERVEESPEARLDPNTILSPCQYRDPLMDPTHEIFRGLDIIWQIPENPQAIVFFAHALNKNPFIFFDPGPKCKVCEPMPEERLATLDALKNGIAVIALQSVDVGWNAWPLDESPDIDNTVALLEWWTQEHHLEALPIIAWGQSIGGTYVASLGASYRIPNLRALVPLVAIEISDQLPLANSSFPPTAFVYFAGNAYEPGLPSEEQVDVMMRSLNQSGVPSIGLKLAPITVTPLYLTEHIHCMTPRWSSDIFDLMHDVGILDEYNYVCSNPGQPDYKLFLFERHILPYCKARNEMCLEKEVIMELKRAYGVHAFSSDANTAVFSWLRSLLGLDDRVLGSATPRLAGE